MRKFSIQSILTWGLQKDDRYGGYKLPVSFKYNEEVVKNIEKIVEKNKCKQVIFGDSKTLYFRLSNITEKQRSELLDKKRMYVDIVFEEDGVGVNRKGISYLRFKVLALKKSEEQHTEDAPKDEM